MALTTAEEERLRFEQREAEQKRLAMQLSADFKAVIDTPAGRRFVRRILAECGVHRLSFRALDTSSYVAFKEGKRSIGLWLQNLFSDHPDEYIKLLKEDSHAIQVQEP